MSTSTTRARKGGIAIDTADVIDKLHDVRALILSAAAQVDVEHGGKDDIAFRVLHQAAGKALDIAHLIDAAAVTGGAA
jgi:hypothetical protein